MHVHQSFPLSNSHSRTKFSQLTQISQTLFGFVGWICVFYRWFPSIRHRLLVSLMSLAWSSLLTTKPSATMKNLSPARHPIHHSPYGIFFTESTCGHHTRSTTASYSCRWVWLSGEWDACWYIQAFQDKEGNWRYLHYNIAGPRAHWPLLGIPSCSYHSFYSLHWSPNEKSFRNN